MERLLDTADARPSRGNLIGGLPGGYAARRHGSVPPWLPAALDHGTRAVVPVGLPTFDEFIFPLLRLLAAHREGMRSSDVYAALALELGLTPEQQAALLPSGRQPVFKNRIGWANDRLRRAKYAESAAHGVWRLTEAGRRFFVDHPDGLNEHEQRALARVDGMPLPAEAEGAVSAVGPDVATAASTGSPEERIDDAVSELHDSLSVELLSVIVRCSPSFFESLVLDVLSAMGYGASRSDIQQTGGTGDGGIDGIIALDKLGLEKVYVQAKRWTNTVGRAQLQAFYGALAGRRARKGVFITTSNFSGEAREFAAQVSDSIVLVDGSMLANLMIEYGVGVTILRTVKLARIDQDYFEE